MSESEQMISAGGLESLTVGNPSSARQIVVLLHGYAMRPQDLSPFAHSMKLPALFAFPRAPLSLTPTSFAWWPVDEERRSQQLARGARDLAHECPSNRAQLRVQLNEHLSALRQLSPGKRLILGGFSQGGMLACDAVLSGERVDGLVLLSSSRIAVDEWREKSHAMHDLPVFVAHGSNDADLSFDAGLALRDFHNASGARVTWQPFEGGHEIPLIVWRSLRTFLKQHSPAVGAVEYV